MMCELAFSTDHGTMYHGDCIPFLREMTPGCADLVFADPPFNLNKDYNGVPDSLSEADYILWCEQWLLGCKRVLAPGGALFVYNLPKWNIILGAYLNQIGLIFRHWIAITMTTGYPIANKLYPRHYSLLYYTNGKPKIFNKQRTAVEKCRHCAGELKDYGGHRKALHQDGISLSDIWTDVAPVRHNKFKNRKANQLPEVILERVIALTTNPGSTVLDPFGGSGTTYAVAERLGRRWFGCEISKEYVLNIKERLEAAYGAEMMCREQR